MKKWNREERLVYYVICGYRTSRELMRVLAQEEVELNTDHACYADAYISNRKDRVGRDYYQKWRAFVQAILHRLVRKGILVRIGWGMYEVTAGGEQLFRRDFN